MRVRIEPAQIVRGPRDLLEEGPPLRQELLPQFLDRLHTVPPMTYGAWPLRRGFSVKHGTCHGQVTRECALTPGIRESGAGSDGDVRPTAAIRRGRRGPSPAPSAWAGQRRANPCRASLRRESPTIDGATSRTFWERIDFIR